MSDRAPFDTLTFSTIPAGKYVLGWRFDDAFDVQARKGIEEFVAFDELKTRFSPERRVALPAFEIARVALPLDTLLGDPYDIEADTISELCDAIDAALAPFDLRLPSEDELEAAAGGALFHWGLQIPDGIPYENETSFRGHRQDNGFSLRLNHDPYRVEIARNVLKFGDGGEAICGGYPWPIAWLALSPAYRLQDADVSECFPETLEAAWVRVVRGRSRVMP
jgi:hypothetical protein